MKHQQARRDGEPAADRYALLLAAKRRLHRQIDIGSGDAQSVHQTMCGRAGLAPIKQVQAVAQSVETERDHV